MRVDSSFKVYYGYHVCEQDYYKSLVPSQLVAERGEEIVVINPGNLLFVSHEPAVIGNCGEKHMRGVVN